MIENFQTFTNSILALPRYAKRTIALISDITFCVISLWIAFYLRLDQFVSLRDNALWAAFFAVSFSIPIFWLFGFYKTMFRYSGKSTLVTISFAVLIYGFLYFTLITTYSFQGVPRSIGLLQPIVLFFLVAGSRLAARYFLGGFYQNKAKKLSSSKVLIYGAGSAGRQLLSAIDNSYEMKVVGFIDDDELLHGQVLQGQTIYPPQDLSDLISSKEVTHVLLALPSVNRAKRMEILKKISKYKIIVHTLPSVSDLVKGRVAVSDIKELEIEDILGRNSVQPNYKLLTKNIDSKTVLVTGAGGSIGSELCRQIIRLNPKKIILLELSEYGLYQIYSELNESLAKNKSLNKLDIVPILASIQDSNRLQDVISSFKPETIYHAAAYKHVSLVEENIFEGIKNNVFGTLTTAQIAIANDVKDFVLISSDKAVRPTNIMGATKRLSELCLQALFNDSKNKNTKLCMVRFGHVLDSSGSVIPKFKKQIRDGGPITLTHPEVTRYFMTIPEAAQLVLQAGAMSKGSDVFVLDMGEPVKIKDLIKKIVTLSGLTIKDEKNPDGDIKITIIGLSPGEKLYEELLIGDDPEPTDHPKISKARDPFLPWKELEQEINKIKKFINEGKLVDILESLKFLIKGYQPSSQILDKIHIQKNKNFQNKNYEEKNLNLNNLDENNENKVVNIERIKQK